MSSCSVSLSLELELGEEELLLGMTLLLKSSKRCEEDGGVLCRALVSFSVFLYFALERAD